MNWKMLWAIVCGVCVGLLSGCVSPPEGKVFRVVCYSGAQIVWQADDVERYVPDKTYFTFYSKAKGTARLGNTACVITEISE